MKTIKLLTATNSRNVKVGIYQSEQVEDFTLHTPSRVPTKLLAEFDSNDKLLKYIGSNKNKTFFVLSINGKYGIYKASLK